MELISPFKGNVLQQFYKGGVPVAFIQYRVPCYSFYSDVKKVFTRLYAAL